MSDTMYIIRKKDLDCIEKNLTDNFGLKLCFKNKKERIFKNDELLITCKKKYISILVYNDEKKCKARIIVNCIS